MPNNHTTCPFMTAVDFLHHENPPNMAGVEPATLGADGQRQTNYATQSAKLNYRESKAKSMCGREDLESSSVVRKLGSRLRGLNLMERVRLTQAPDASRGGEREPGFGF
ncbi:hypothetical protein TNCV_2379741 [Trichonephila clavipes]|uniref:Uncharacterized protein n=1 Tax=Trichonephila clavipes TaxID=2585209 RepID=A0A8X6RGM4_TRICX|nr:hypothetical protein TNCV_2379741 [Trichonephila clavipes]